VTNSMFACLPVDDEAEVKRKNRGGKKKEGEEGKKKKNENDAQNNKNKKKDKNSLQSAAVLSNKSKKKSQTPTPQPQPSSPPAPSTIAEQTNQDPDWDQWRERDAENVDTEFERNLEQALLLSKLEADQEQTLRAIAGVDAPPSSAPSSSTTTTTSSTAAKKKKQKKNSDTKAEKTVSLATFLHETPDPAPPVTTDEIALDDPLSAGEGEEADADAIIIAPHFATLVPRAKTYEVEATFQSATETRGDDAQDFISADHRSKDAKDRAAKEKDSKREKETEERQFFEQVQRDVGKIIRKEECSEFLKQNEHIISETVRSAHFRADIEEKESLIEELRSEMDSMKEEFAKVKKRNKQLAFIISQGEMQEKADLLTEIDELKEVKDELTSQTALLQQELEQERTKNHKMTKELLALKGHKGGKQPSPQANES